MVFWNFIILFYNFLFAFRFASIFTVVVIVIETVEYLMTGNRGCHNPFTIKEWIILVCVMLTVGFGIFLGSSILASYINRQTTPSKYVKKGKHLY